MIRIYSDLKDSTKKMINNKINDYLDIYMDFYRNLGPEEGFSSFFPRLIWIEKQDKCIQTMIELDAWTSDDHLHRLKPIHEMALFRLLCFTQDYWKDHGMHVGENYEDEEQTDDEYIMDNLDDIDLYLHILFQDHDFRWVAQYTQEFMKDPYDFENRMNINLDEYTDLMPNDIREEYLNIKKSLYPSDISINKSGGEILSFEDFIFHIDRIMEYFSHSITLKGAYKLLWNEDGSAKNEKSAQQLLDFISRFYCENNNIDITPEAATGTGPVDFKFSYGNDFKVIAEIKRGYNNLKHGLEKQTIQYMLSEKVTMAYFVVIIQYDNELNKSQKMIDSAISIKSERGLTIKPIIIDARQNKQSASKTF
ncbi:hypothetical protein EJP77_18695 [Paenibacillus zeisoli]|uniref:Uncharacterized protein n=1 Tax=Paenibacillus zeisoli TaxID=2496267 RepID=A0A433X1P6_9BACL|nr:hypothetical protein [Paenibacillus zeisoli]RUT28045.1 hypothetical protein EJP77_18695 [Paenibacillus zeisoli]